jgi:transposase InsO family protein
MTLLISSTPADFHAELTSFPTACEALTWICSKYQGGHDLTINNEWLRQFTQEGMTREETLEQYVRRKVNLFKSLLANHHQMSPMDLPKYIIDGLPPEFNHGKVSLYAPCAAATPAVILATLRQHAHGIGFNDMKPRPEPKAAKTTTPESDSTEKGGRGRGRPRCWECGKIGHISKDCKKKKEETAESPEACKPRETTVKTDMPKVTHNVYNSPHTASCAEEWLIDSGASVHLVNDVSILQNMTVFNEPRPLQLATEGARGSIVASGSVCLLNQEGKPVWLHNVQCVPEASSNLLSVSAGIRDGLIFAVNDSGAYVRVEGADGWMCRVQEEHGLYNLKGVYPTTVPLVCQKCFKAITDDHLSPTLKHDCKLRQLWHERLGHPGKTVSERLTREQLCTGIPVSLIPCAKCDTHCDSCIRGKQSKPPFPDSSRRPTRILHRIHADTVGEVPTAGTGGERYFLTVVEEYSGYVDIIPVQQKSSIAHELINVIARWERQTDSKVQVVRTDRGTEFLNKTFHGYCAQNGIHTEMSAAYTPQQNGVAERANRTIKEKVRTLLLGVNADNSLWNEAAQTAAYLHNVTPVSGKSKTPYEEFYGHKPDLSGLRKWGCLAYVKHEKHQVHPMGAQSVAGMFVGYDRHSKGYRVRVGNKVIVSRNVHFVEGKSGAVVLGRLAAQHDEHPAVERYSPVESEVSSEDGEHDTTLVPAATPNPFHPLMDQDNDDNEEEPSTSMPSSPRAEPTTSGAAASSGSTAKTDVEPTLECSKEPSAAVPKVLEKLLNAAREPDLSHGPSAGTRARAKNTLRLMTGQPLFIRPSRGGRRPRQAQDKERPVLTREERLQRRNALKEQGGTEEVERRAEGTDEAVVDERGEEAVSEEKGVEEEVELVTLEEGDGDAGTLREADETEEVIALHVQDAQSHTYTHARCESRKENVLRKERGSERGEAIDDEYKQGKARGWNNVSNKSAEEVVDEGDQVEDVAPSVSLAFMKACLASPSEVKFCKVHVPNNYREARRSEQWELWEAAMNEEMDSLNAHECFEYVERQRGKKIIPVHWIYSVKVDEFGNVIRYKARLVAQGCRQVQGIDVDEVFAPTSSFGARRALLAKAAQEDLEIHQVDIKTAFLNGDLEEEVYVTQPPGFENGGPQVCRLKKALYGLKQAPRAWYKTLDGILEKHGFTACMSDAGIYVSVKGTENPVYLALFVDDMLIVCKDLEKVLAFKDTLGKEFTIHDLGEVKDFLGCQVVRDRNRRVIQMSSGPKIDALVEKFGLSGETRSVESPMSKSFLPTAKSGDVLEGGGAGTPLEPGNRYCELIGSLLYLANTTRPDISQAVGVLSRYRGTPTSAHMQEGLRLVRYLKGTRDHALQLGGSHVVIEGFVDADYAGDLDTRASTTGFVYKVYGGAVVWGSKKQTATATSTVEAEFRAASHAVKEAQWLRGLLEELDFDVWKIPLYCDNTGCIQNLKNPVNSKYTKHVAVSFHHARQAVIQGQVDIKYIATQANMADIFTKPLVPVLFRQHRDTLGVIQRIMSA